jgi:hypothetical protein
VPFFGVQEPGGEVGVPGGGGPKKFLRSFDSRLTPSLLPDRRDEWDRPILRRPFACAAASTGHRAGTASEISCEARPTARKTRQKIFGVLDPQKGPPRI